LGPVRNSDVAGAHFHAATASVRMARRMASDAVAGWQLDDLVDAVELCTGELAANAVLHGRTSFDVVLRREGDSVRIDVIDQRPDEIPAQIPLTGTAADITRMASTGRGLQLVAGTADRWGFTTTEEDKSVWAEIGPEAPEIPSQPVVVLGKDAAGEPGDVHLELRSMPVRAAVASGVHVDEIVRSLQLREPGTETAVLPDLYRLLEVSAGPRLGGRHAALRAAGRNEVRFDLVFDTTMEALAALGALNRLLEDLATRRDALPVEDGVLDYRAWLRDETTRQLQGDAPQPCHLP
jgi:anti-sigma regulatory factor (Ser/Thr protein kinase)